MVELNQTDGSIRYGNVTYYVPSGSEPLLQDDFVAARPAIVQLKYPSRASRGISSFPRMLLATSAIIVQKSSRKSSGAGAIFPRANLHELCSEQT